MSGQRPRALEETSPTCLNGGEYDFLHGYLNRHEDARIFMAHPNVFGSAYRNGPITHPAYDLYQITVGRALVRMMAEGCLLPIDRMPSC